MITNKVNQITFKKLIDQIKLAQSMPHHGRMMKDIASRKTMLKKERGIHESEDCDWKKMRLAWMRRRPDGLAYVSLKCRYYLMSSLCRLRHFVY